MIRNNKNQNNKRKRHNESQSEDDRIISYNKIRKNILSTSEFEEQNSTTPEKDILYITWTTKPARPKVHSELSRQNSGIRVPINYSASILNYFQLFFSENFVEFIVNTTNDYEKRIDNNVLTHFTRDFSCRNVSFLLHKNIDVAEQKTILF